PKSYQADDRPRPTDNLMGPLGSKTGRGGRIITRQSSTDFQSVGPEPGVDESVTACGVTEFGPCGRAKMCVRAYPVQRPVPCGVVLAIHKCCGGLFFTLSLRDQTCLVQGAFGCSEPPIPSEPRSSLWTSRRI
ncbi:MAG: hypothetical protein ACK51T_14075, partial [bacterium]